MKSTDKAKWQIENAASDAVKVIANAAIEAAKVVANAAAEASKVLIAKNADGSTDHDLIIKLDTKMDALKEDIKQINDGTGTKITDHELRLRRVEMWGAIALGLSYALQLYFHFSYIK